MVSYNTIPGIDEGYNFPPQVRQSIAASSEIQAKIENAVPDAVSEAIAENDVVIQAAIDALLNAAVLEKISFNKGPLSANTDLNNVLESGLYEIDPFETISNRPTDAISSLLVEEAGPRTIQVVKTTHNIPQVFTRVGYNSGTVWHPWKRVDVSWIEDRLVYLEQNSVTTSETRSSGVKIKDEYGRELLTFTRNGGRVRLQDSDSPYTETIPNDSLEIRDSYGRYVLAIDDRSTTPRFRDGTSQETHFILLLGQSNSVGVGAPIVEGTNDPLPNLYVVPQNSSGPQPVELAAEPLSHPFNTPQPDTIGHGWTVARKYALEHPNVKVVILPLSRTGSGFRHSTSAYTWSTFRISEPDVVNLYSEAISRSANSMAMFQGKKRVAMVLWHQGEADAMGSTSGVVYQQELDALISGIRANVTGAENAPFIIGQLGYEFREVRKEGTVSEINSVHISTPSRIRKVGFAEAPPAGYMQTDNTHFKAEGQKLLADKMWDAYQKALYNI